MVRQDKVFNNGYNTLNYAHDIIYGQTIEIDQTYKNYTEIDYNHLEIEKLQEEFLEIFRRSKFKRLNKKEINKKSALMDMFISLIEIYSEKLDEKKITNLEFLLAFNESFDIDYNLMYRILPEKFKSDLLTELDIELRERKQKKIF